MSGIPTEEDWRSEPWGVDTPYAFKHFSGKSREEATVLFVENALHYQEDVAFMPTRCFRYYVHSYIDYLMSDDSRDDSDGASCFYGLVDVRADDIASLDESTRHRIIKLLDRLGHSQAWYGADPGIYGDFSTHSARCLKLIQ